MRKKAGLVQPENLTVALTCCCCSVAAALSLSVCPPLPAPLSLSHLFSCSICCVISVHCLSSAFLTFPQRCCCRMMVCISQGRVLLYLNTSKRKDLQEKTNSQPATTPAGQQQRYPYRSPSLSRLTCMFDTATHARCDFFETGSPCNAFAHKPNFAPAILRLLMAASEVASERWYGIPYMLVKRYICLAGSRFSGFRGVPVWFLDEWNSGKWMVCGERNGPSRPLSPKFFIQIALIIKSSL